MPLPVLYPFDSHRNRKGCFAIVCLGCADTRGKFLYFDPGWAGSTHDSRAYSESKIKEIMSSPDWPKQFFLIGDEAFANTDAIMTPWPGRGIGVAKDAFNYTLSRARTCIERAFGMLVRRWGILWRRLEVDYERWALVVRVCAKLHNLCVDDNVPAPYVPDTMGENREVYDPRPHLNDDVNNDDKLNHGGVRGQPGRRTAITERMEAVGLERPPSARVNSRAHA